LKPHYSRIALISHRQHLKQLDIQDDNTLIVMTDWPLWQQCVKSGMHCTTYETGLFEWSKTNKDKFEKIYDSDWCLINDMDATKFHSVSLGKLFATETGVIAAGYMRLDQALRKLIEIYKPKEIVFYDYRIDLNILPLEIKRYIVESAAADYDITLIDKFDDPGDSNPDLPCKPSYAWFPKERRLSIKKIVLFIYEFLFDSLSRLIILALPKRRRILMPLGFSLNSQLENSFSSRLLLPLFSSRLMPKKLGLVVPMLLKLAALYKTPEVKLSHNDKTELRNIIDNFKTSWNQQCSGLEQAIRIFVSNKILHTGWFQDRAKEIIQNEKLFDLYKPSHVIVDSAKGVICRIRTELAYNRGITVDYLWHAPFNVQNFRFESLGCDPRFPAQVTRCLSWGIGNDSWLNRIDAKTKIARCGNPILNAYSQFNHKPKPRPDKVLLLQSTPIETDIEGLYANGYAFIVETIQMLQDLGVKEVRLKLHPGHTRTSYYQRIVNYFGLDVLVLKREPFIDCVRWADCVIGPVVSGAMYEVLAGGKPYYPFVLEPNVFDLSDYEDISIYKDVDSLKAGLINNECINADNFLRKHCSKNEISDSAQRVWEILELDV